MSSTITEQQTGPETEGAQPVQTGPATTAKQERTFPAGKTAEEFRAMALRSPVPPPCHQFVRGNQTC